MQSISTVRKSKLVSTQLVACLSLASSLTIVEKKKITYFLLGRGKEEVSKMKTKVS